MSKTTKTFVQIFVALALAGVTGIMLFKYMSANQAKVNQPQKEAATVSIIVAANDLPRGSKLTAQGMTTAPFLPQSLPPGTFTDAAQIEGRVLATSLAAGEPILQIRLAPEEVRSGGVASMISPGHRAMSVKGNKVMGLAGFVRPGNRVDVLVTIMTGEMDSEPMTKLVLSNVLVLATGEELEPALDGGTPSPVDTYTFEVTPEESERLALAANQGTLNFALRNDLDTEEVLTSGASIDSALASFRPAEAEKPKRRTNDAPTKPKTTVEVISGAERNTVTF